MSDSEPEREVVLFSRSKDHDSVFLVGNSQLEHRILTEDVGADSPPDYKSTDEEQEALAPNDDKFEYDHALRTIGFGPVHLLIVFGTGLALAADSIEVLAVSYILEEIQRKGELLAGEVITPAHIIVLSCIIFLGMMVGGYVWGSLSDLSGRKRALLMSLTLNGVAGLLSGFVRNYYYLLALRFVSGIGVGGSLPIVGSYCAEFVDSKKRAKFLGLLSSFWIFGQTFAAGLAFAIIPQRQINDHFFLHSWQLFTIVAAVPSLVAALVYLVLPESPKFLHQAGKYEKALENLRKVHRINRLLMCKPPAEFPIAGIKVNKNPEDDVTLPSCMSRRGCRFVPSKIKSVLWRSAQLFRPRFLRRTIPYLIVYFCLSFGSFGITLWFPSYLKKIQVSLQNTTAMNSTIPDQTNKLYLDAVIFASASIPGTIVTVIAVDLPKMTRNIWLGCLLLASGAVLFLVLIPVYVASITIALDDYSVIILSVFNGVSIGAWNTMSLITAEIYPTFLRTTAGAVGLVSVRIGAILGLVLFGLLVETSFIVPVVMVACVMSVGSIVSFFLPRTTKRTRLE